MRQGIESSLDTVNHGGESRKLGHATARMVAAAAALATFPIGVAPTANLQLGALLVVILARPRRAIVHA